MTEHQSDSARTNVHVIVPLHSGNRTSDTAPFERDDLAVDIVHINENGPTTLECAYNVARVEQEVVDLAMAAERAGADAVVTDCMRDVAIATAREMVSIPVLGPAQTSMHLAAMLGRRFSVLVTLPRSIEVVEDQVMLHGLKDSFASARAVNIGVEHLHDDDELLVKRLTEEAKAAVVEDGAHVVILGCTAMDGIGRKVRDGLAALGHPGIPVIEPLQATIRMGQILHELGLSHSRRTYPDATSYLGR
ncbi:aspartate/glutamate racemase family protein [Phytohabitans kaempferiae]|uniref:Aspartate/glutamate racemase family protein n=1 Tax=Phytohabitans kaempferiae TaxID=1620943 RepID=A0ABV6MA55_9ACTN